MGAKPRGIDRRAFLQIGTVAALVAGGPASMPAAAASPAPALPLPPPQMEGGKPLMQALRERKSSRSFKPDKLAPQVLSNLLWAAFGINRPAAGGRTAPSANNSQEIEVYAATADGLYLFEPKTHALKPLGSEDIRGLTGRQDFVKEAPLNLIYVSDPSKMTRASTSDREFYTAAHTGFVSQNVYLYCASEGLATVVRASMDRSALAKAMNLRSEQRIMLAQTVGLPK